MKALAIRFITLGIVLVLAVWPTFAQEAPDPATEDQAQTQSVDQGQGDQDQGAPAMDDTSSAPTPTPAPVSADPAAVIAQWGAAPSIGPDADSAVAQRWFRDQNAMRARWGVPTATRDPYLDWQAENYLRSQLGQPPLAPPQGLSKPPAAASSPRSDQALITQPQFWTVSDEVWLAWLDTGRAPAIEFWEEAHPGEQYYSRDVYMDLFRQKQTPHFDLYRLMGVAGRVNTGGDAPTDLAQSGKDQLEQIAPGLVQAYQPMVYLGNVVAVVAYDPWINADGSPRP